MTHLGNISNHFDAMHHLLSGQAGAPDDSPYIGSILSKVRPSERNVASYVWLIKCVGDPVFCAPNIGTGGHLGAVHSPLFVGSANNHPAMPNFRGPELFGAVDADRMDGAPAACSTDRQPAAKRERRSMRVTGLARPAQPGFRTGDRPARPPGVRTGPRADAGRATATAGIRWVRICCWRGGSSRRASASSPSTAGPARRRRAEGGARPVSSSWDMHGGHMGMGNAFGNGSYGMGWCLPRLDEALSALLDDLHDRGLLERTLVVVVGEFGRSPRINTTGAAGPPALAAMLLRHPRRRRHSRRRGLRRIRPHRRLRQGQPGAAAGPRRHDLPRARRLPRDAPGPRRLHPPDHDRAACFRICSDNGVTHSNAPRRATFRVGQASA